MYSAGDRGVDGILYKFFFGGVLLFLETGGKRKRKK